MTENWKERARKRMRDTGETQNSLSEKLDMTQGGLQHWLAGTRQPALDDINRIAELLGCSPVWLTHGIGENDSTAGLAESTQAVLRQVIADERAGRLPTSFWVAVKHMRESVAPSASPQTQPSSASHETEPLSAEPSAPRNGTHG